MDNLELYNQLRFVPESAKKEIKGGRLAGKTDINPMWRIKVLTETFGPCGFGWYYKVTDKWMEKGGDNDIAAFIQIELFVKRSDEWSQPIVGTGGSSFVTTEKNGLYTSDECYKMALTDAISVACKALGIGADVYWDKDSTKYTNTPNQCPAPGKKTLLRQQFNDPILMEWLYKHEKNTTPYNLLESNYALSKEDINEIIKYYIHYKKVIKHEEPADIPQNGSGQ